MFALWWQQKHWHAESQLLVARFILFTRRCQTNLSRVPSLGQLWECIKTVKMAAVTGSWHSLHLGMVSKYDIPAFCPKVVIWPLKHATGPLQLLYGYHAPPTGLLCNLHQTLVFAATFFPPVLSAGPTDPLCSALLGRIRPFLLPHSCYHSSTLHSSFSLHLFCSPSVSLHFSSFSLLSPCSCHLLH